MRVRFGGEEATEVAIESTTKLWCLTPVGDPGVVDVRVDNLDDNGEPIAGETATLANAYTYARPYIIVPKGATSLDRYRGDLHRLVMQVVTEWRRQVLENTVLKKPHKDYSDNPSSGKVRLSKLPGIVMFGPRLTVNRELSEPSFENHDYTAGLFKRRRHVEARDVSFTFSAVCESQFEALNLLEVIDRFFDKNTSIKLLRDPTNSSRGYAEFEMIYTDLASVTPDIDGDNQTVIEGGFFVQGFEMQSSAGFTDDGVEFIGNVVNEVVTTGEPYDEE